MEDKTQDVAHLEGTISNGPEKPANILDDAAAKGQVLSGFEELGAIATIKKFKRAFLFCFMSAFSAACDGYQVRCVVWNGLTIDRLEWKRHCKSRIRRPVRNDYQPRWQPSAGRASVDSYWHHSISWPNRRHDYDAFVS